MNNETQTAVECFSNKSWKLKIRLENKEISIGEYAVAYVKLLDEAKEMEKQQVVEAYGNGYEAGFTSEYCVPEQYYNKTYKTK
jgi:hypothetical protein